MSSSYPPGVTGNEPAITGRIEYDPHAPFWVGRDEDGGGPHRWVIYYADDETPWFGAGETRGWTNRQHAQDFADKLNARWYLRFEDRGHHGFCRVCGDLHGELPGLRE